MKYPSDLTTTQWSILKPLFPKEKRGAHFVKHSKRKLIDAVLYMEKAVVNGGNCRMIFRNGIQ